VKVERERRRAVRRKKQEVLDALALEREVLTKGGYAPSVREPRNTPRLLRDSVTCLNHAFAERRRPCSECGLIEYVPEASRREAIPCHHIPLDDRGGTIASLEAAGDRPGAESALLGWIDRTLEREAAGAA
jgi:hypothetical protein